MEFAESHDIIIIETYHVRNLRIYLPSARAQIRHQSKRHNVNVKPTIWPNKLRTKRSTRQNSLSSKDVEEIFTRSDVIRENY